MVVCSNRLANCGWRWQAGDLLFDDVLCFPLWSYIYQLNNFIMVVCWRPKGWRHGEVVFSVKNKYLLKQVVNTMKLLAPYRLTWSSTCIISATYVSLNGATHLVSGEVWLAALLIGLCVGDWMFDGRWRAHFNDTYGCWMKTCCWRMVTENGDGLLSVHLS